MKVKITELNINWHNIKNACMKTISKSAGPGDPPVAWRRKLLICRHSPIRKGYVVTEGELPYAISTHFARHHEGVEKFISTSREDRTGVKRDERSQMDPVLMELDMNIQGLFNICEKRLCMCADPTTREYTQMMLEELKDKDPDVYWACVPQCVRCGGCVEPFSDCHFFETFAKDLTKEELMNVETRYDKYNEFREKHLVKKRNV